MITVTANDIEDLVEQLKTLNINPYVERLKKEIKELTTENINLKSNTLHFYSGQIVQVDKNIKITKGLDPQEIFVEIPAEHKGKNIFLHYK